MGQAIRAMMTTRCLSGTWEFEIEPPFWPAIPESRRASWSWCQAPRLG
ncbi:hypothetical protein ACFPRL_36315 [Pseudoclavibacter helvolus]